MKESTDKTILDGSCRLLYEVGSLLMLDYIELGGELHYEQREILSIINDHTWSS